MIINEQNMNVEQFAGSYSTYVSLAHVHLGCRAHCRTWLWLGSECNISHLDKGNPKYNRTLQLCTQLCVWCICSKDKCHLEKNFSIVDEELGARTVDGIIKASKFYLQFHFKMLSLIHSICFSESVIP